MKPIIEVNKLSKKYKFKENATYESLRDSIVHLFYNGNHKKNTNEFWALKKISFSVMPGEVVGIIGKNGAGKSTLLKILSQITPPTEGKAILRGRVASLLEIGTGFHPELTGRENIYLNGAILGMTRKEIKKKFDEIVDFAEIEQFLDTAVKHYSSGMYMRLAFAIAAHLDTEILFVDEILAVGDYEFQKKCLGKMHNISNEGRTVLFVSHNIEYIRKLCTRALLLENKTVKKIGDVNKVLAYYLKSHSSDQTSIRIKADRILPSYAEKLTIQNSRAVAISKVLLGQPWQIEVVFTVTKPVKHYIIGIGITTQYNFPVRTVWSNPVNIEPGRYKAVFYEDTIIYEPGNYFLTIGISSFEKSIQYLPEVAKLEIIPAAIDTKHTIVKTSGSGVILNPMPITITKL
jgi:lipopolysaccharide transport system ATP-binding protein